MCTLLLLLVPAAEAANGPLAVTTRCGYESGRYLSSMELVDLSGSLERRMYPCGDNPSFVSWAPDGESYLYTSSGRKTVLSDTGRTQENVVADGWAAHFAPDGERFSFVRNYNMWVGTIDGAPPVKLRHERLPGSAWWSRDGSMLAFNASNEGGVKVIDATTGEDVRRAAGRSYGVAGWLPDGRILLIRGCAKECRFGLFTVDPLDGQPRRLPGAPKLPIDSAALSPDGRRIAMVVLQRMKGGYARSTVSVMRVAGGEPRLVLRSPRYKYRSRSVSGVPAGVTWKPEA